MSLKDGKQFWQSKGIWGGVVLALVGAYQLYHGDSTAAVESFGQALAAIGIRMAVK